jgi:prepilin-type N-terminal cleavage/methylation domain-containing protein
MALKRGFSLIELIVVIGLLSLLMLAISSTMLMSIVSSSRIRTTTKVKQAGGYAIGQIQAMVRGAKTITICDSGNATIEVVNLDGGATELLAESDGTDFRIASNSGIYITPEKMTVTGFTVTCLPDETEPSLIKFAFDLQDTKSEQSTQNPILHFETSINTRN